MIHRSNVQSKSWIFSQVGRGQESEIFADLPVASAFFDRNSQDFFPPSNRIDPFEADGLFGDRRHGYAEHVLVAAANSCKDLFAKRTG